MIKCRITRKNIHENPFARIKIHLRFTKVWSQNSLTNKKSYSLSFAKWMPCTKRWNIVVFFKARIFNWRIGGDEKKRRRTVSFQENSRRVPAKHPLRHVYTLFCLTGHFVIHEVLRTQFARSWSLSFPPLVTPAKTQLSDLL